MSDGLHRDGGPRKTCNHPYGSVRQRSADVVVSGNVIDNYEVMFCTSCESILERV